MKLENTGSDSLDLIFEVPEPGKSILIVEEGIRKNYNENSGKTTLLIPFTIDKVLEGPEGNEGLKLTHFVPIESKFGEKQLRGILSLTDLMDKFANKFGPEVDITDDSFLNSLKLKLVGKFLTGTHTLREDNNGKKRCDIMKFERTGKAKAQTEAKVDSPKPAATSDEDW